MIAEALAALMASRAVDRRGLDGAVSQLREAVGLEESATAEHLAGRVATLEADLETARTR